jgi:hypothetical protein
VWLLILVGAFFFSSYAAWREEYLKPAVNEVKPIQSTDWGSRTLTFWMSPEHRAQQEHTRAIQEQVRESHRERVPEVFAIVRRVALSSVGQGCTIEMALELTNSGADTRLQDWRVIFDLPNGEQRTVTTFASGDAVPSVSANQRRPVNLATYSELVRRGAHIVGWLACSADKAVAEATKPPKVEAFDDLGNQIRVLWNPRQSGGR